MYSPYNPPISPIRKRNQWEQACIIYTIVAYTVGWIGGTSSILHGIIAAIFQIALAFIIWGGFMLHYRNDVRKMNEKIKEL